MIGNKTKTIKITAICYKEDGKLSNFEQVQLVFDKQTFQTLVQVGLILDQQWEIISETESKY